MVEKGLKQMEPRAVVGTMGVVGNNDIYFDVQKGIDKAKRNIFIWKTFLAIFEEFSISFYFFKSFYAFAFVSGIVILTEEMIIVGNFTERKGSGKKRGCEKKKKKRKKTDS